jgi:hypothetical protein
MKKVALFFLIMTGYAFSGCGEKITIPQPKGLFNVSAYKEAAQYDDIPDPRQLILHQGSVFLLNETTLSKRDQYLLEMVSVTGFGNPTALCVMPETGLIFVYDEANSTVSMYQANDLLPMGSVSVPEVQSVVSMVTQNSGIELVTDGITFLYLSDPIAGVIHRYGVTIDLDLVPFGVLATGGGQSARFVHQPAGLARDMEGKLLVCEADLQRNWVIRFDSTPDLEDTTPDPDDIDPMRGLVFPFRQLECVTQPTAAYVLGDAPGCDETSWEGAPSDAEGEFAGPQGAAVDGSGRTFVADTENNRVQIFSSGLDGEEGGIYNFGFVIDGETPRRPVGISVLDRQLSPTQFYYAAYVYIVVPDDGMIYKFISAEEFEARNPGTPFIDQ